MNIKLWHTQSYKNLWRQAIYSFQSHIQAKIHFSCLLNNWYIWFIKYKLHTSTILPVKKIKIHQLFNKLEKRNFAYIYETIYLICNMNQIISYSMNMKNESLTWKQRKYIYDFVWRVFSYLNQWLLAFTKYSVDKWKQIVVLN
jgi:hypothetical protein